MVIIQVGYGPRVLGTSCIRLWTGSLASQLLKSKLSDHPHRHGKIMKKVVLLKALAECDAYLLIDRNPFSDLEFEEQPTHKSVTMLKRVLEAVLATDQPYYEVSL